MLQPMCLDDYGLTNPPAVVHAVEQGALSRDKSRAAEREFDLERWPERVKSGVAKLIADAEGRSIQDLELGVQAFERIEEELLPSREDLLGVRKTSRGLKADAMRLPAAMRGVLLANASRLDENAEKLLGILESVLRSYRDGRWQLMAMCAQSTPSSPTPVFQDADSLLAFLQG